MARLRNFVRKIFLRGFRAVLFRMVPKLIYIICWVICRFRAVLFRMVPKHEHWTERALQRFRAVLFRMVPKRILSTIRTA